MIILQSFGREEILKGRLYDIIKNNAYYISFCKFDAVWLPPPYKDGDGVSGLGYGVYDYYDLGEFHQKGTTSTRWGNKQQLQECLKVFREKYRNVSPIIDLPLTAMFGADFTQDIDAIIVSDKDRNIELGELSIKAYTHFEHLGRGEKYNNEVVDASLFNAVDYDKNTGLKQILRFKGTSFSEYVSKENGNFDFLFGVNLDYSNPKTVRYILDAIKWLITELGVNFLRLDALKHIDRYFIKDLVSCLPSDFRFLGEYCESSDLSDLVDYINNVDIPNTLYFDMFTRSNLSKVESGEMSICSAFDRTLAESHPDKALVFVDTHDTADGGILGTEIKLEYKLRFYALLLLCGRSLSVSVFYKDLYNPKICTYLLDLITIHKLKPVLLKKECYRDDNVITLMLGFLDGSSAIVVLSGYLHNYQQGFSLNVGKKDTKYFNIFDKSDTVETDGRGVGNGFKPSLEGVGVYMSDISMLTNIR